MVTASPAVEMSTGRSRLHVSASWDGGGRALRRENVNLRLIVENCVSVGHGILEQTTFPRDARNEYSCHLQFAVLCRRGVPVCGRARKRCSPKKLQVESMR